MEKFLKGLVFGTYANLDTYGLVLAKENAQRFELFSSKNEYEQGLELGEFVFEYLQDLSKNLSKSYKARDFLDEIMCFKRQDSIKIGLDLDLNLIVLQKAQKRAYDECFEKNFIPLFGLFIVRDFSELSDDKLRYKRYLLAKNALTMMALARKCDNKELLKSIESLSKGTKEFYKACGADLEAILKEKQAKKGA